MDRKNSLSMTSKLATCIRHWQTASQLAKPQALPQRQSLPSCAFITQELSGSKSNFKSSHFAGSLTKKHR